MMVNQSSLLSWIFVHIDECVGLIGVTGSQVKVTLQLTVSQSVSLGVEPQIVIIFWQLRFWYCGAPSLTRGRVCLFYMLLALARVVFLGSESLGTRDHVLLQWLFYKRFSNKTTTGIPANKYEYAILDPRHVRVYVIASVESICSTSQGMLYHVKATLRKKSPLEGCVNIRNILRSDDLMMTSQHTSLTLDDASTFPLVDGV
jgi:hypothetical protein